MTKNARSVAHNHSSSSLLYFLPLFQVPNRSWLLLLGSLKTKCNLIVPVVGWTGEKKKRRDDTAHHHPPRLAISFNRELSNSARLSSSPHWALCETRRDPQHQLFLFLTLYPAFSTPCLILIKPTLLLLAAKKGRHTLCNP